MEPHPITTPGRITDRDPIQDPDPITTGAPMRSPARRFLLPISCVEVRMFSNRAGAGPRRRAGEIRGAIETPSNRAEDRHARSRGVSSGNTRATLLPRITAGRMRANPSRRMRRILLIDDRFTATPYRQSIELGYARQPPNIIPLSRGRSAGFGARFDCGVGSRTSASGLGSSRCSSDRAASSRIAGSRDPLQSRRRQHA